jgi:hypothetical protein
MASLKKALQKAVLVNMKNKEKPPEVVEQASESTYPYGLVVRLDNKVMKSLKLSVDDFNIDKEVMLKAKCDVVALRSEKHRGMLDEFVELQITDLAIIKE